MDGPAHRRSPARAGARRGGAGAVGGTAAHRLSLGHGLPPRLRRLLPRRPSRRRFRACRTASRQAYPAYSSTNSCAAASSASRAPRVCRSLHPMHTDVRRLARKPPIFCGWAVNLPADPPTLQGTAHKGMGSTGFRQPQENHQMKLYYPGACSLSPHIVLHPKPAWPTRPVLASTKTHQLADGTVSHHQPLGCAGAGAGRRHPPARRPGHRAIPWPTRRRTKPGTSPWHAGPLPPAGVADRPLGTGSTRPSAPLFVPGTPELQTPGQTAACWHACNGWIASSPANPI